MNSSRTFIQKLTSKSCTLFFRYYSNVVAQELKIQTFSDININLPYHIDIKPLDVHKYHQMDKLQIELIGVNSTNRTIKHIQDSNNIQIFTKTQNFDDNITCVISAPIKSNLVITALGNISAGFFNGSRLILKSLKGNIYVEKYTGNEMDLCTKNGNITLKGPVVAASIKANVLDNGSIKTRKLQGLKSHLKTKQGDISVDASYCDNCIFEVGSGSMDLQNIHKNNKILIDNGDLTLNGLDGQLDAVLTSGKADIQVTRILEDSKISIEEEGELTLRMSEECQDKTVFEITPKDHDMDPSIRLIPSKTDSTLYLMPLKPVEDCKRMFVYCKKSNVKILSASWMSMLKLNAQK